MRAHELRILSRKVDHAAALIEIAEHGERDQQTRSVLRAALALVKAACEHLDDQARCSPIGVEVAR